MEGVDRCVFADLQMCKPISAKKCNFARAINLGAMFHADNH